MRSTTASCNVHPHAPIISHLIPSFTPPSIAVRSYFAIFGALFGFRNFGRLVAVDNLFNGLFGLLQYPLTYLAIHPLNGNFLIVNLSLVGVVGGGNAIGIRF